MSNFEKQISPDLEPYVLDALKRQKNIQDIVVPYLISNTGWDWQECEKFIEKVRLDHRDELSKWQGNFYSILSVGLLVVGLALVIFSFEADVGFSRLFHCTAVEIDKLLNGLQTNECSTFGLEAAFVLTNRYIYLGAAFTVGGIIGIVLANQQKQSQQVIQND